MAVIQNTAVVGQIRGKLNGSQFNKSRTANTLQRKAQQSKSWKGNQQQARRDFQFVQRGWKLRTPVQQSMWQQVANNNPDRDRFGNLVVLSGYNKYVQCMLLSLKHGDIVNPTPDVSPAPSFSVNSLNITNAVFTTTVSGMLQIAVTFSFTASAYSDDFGVGLYMSLPVSPGVTSYNGRYVWLWVCW